MRMGHLPRRQVPGRGLPPGHPAPGASASEGEGSCVGAMKPGHRWRGSGAPQLIFQKRYVKEGVLLSHVGLRAMILVTFLNQEVWEDLRTVGALIRSKYHGHTK